MSELAVLRTKLRALNIEYSALVRGKAEEGAFARMEELRGERRELMALIAQQRRITISTPSIVLTQFERAGRDGVAPRSTKQPAALRGSCDNA